MNTQILQWLVTTATLFLVFVTVALLSGYPVSAFADKWLIAALPNWLQAISTVTAAYIAWVVFKNWREPERAKAKALHAPRILKCLKPYKEAFHAARFSTRSYDFPLEPKWIAIALSEQRGQAMEALWGPLRELKEIQEETTDPQTGALVDGLINMGETLLGAWQTVQELKVDLILHNGTILEDDPIALDDREQDEFGTYFQILGLRRRHHHGDVFKVDFDAKVQDLRTLLRHHISFSSPD